MGERDGAAGGRLEVMTSALRDAERRGQQNGGGRGSGSGAAALAGAAAGRARGGAAALARLGGSPQAPQHRGEPGRHQQGRGGPHHPGGPRRGVRRQPHLRRADGGAGPVGRGACHTGAALRAAPAPPRSRTGKVTAPRAVCLVAGG